MKCLTPYRMKNPKYPDESDFKYIDCPCGKCFICLTNRRNSWLFRLRNESLCSYSTYFVTLTYNDDFSDGHLHRKHLTCFFKLLRKKLSLYGQTFKYYAIGEYGTTTFRPHYHFIAFVYNKPYSDYDFSSVVENLWKYGFIECSFANASTMNYVLHYHVRPKFPFGKNDPRKTFSAFSKRLGLSFILDKDGVLNKGLLHQVTTSSNRLVGDVFGNIFTLPRYYIKKIVELGYEPYVVPRSSSLIFDDFSKEYIPNCNEALKIMFPDLKFNPDGLPSNMSMFQYLSLLNGFDTISERKLKKYNYQDKF